jgi:hypothetical protein
MGRRDHLTFKGNLRRTRYGWLRLTPAYSVHQVEELLGDDKDAVVLDPFCGTGTTALVCAERGITCDTLDINPFLVWLARVKAAAYETAELGAFAAASGRVADAIRSSNGRPAWVPPLHRIEKWWDGRTLAALSHALLAAIRSLEASLPAKAADLLKVAFCLTMMGHARVSFGHQSMSFKKKGKREEPAALLPGFEDHPVAATWEQAVSSIATAAKSPVARQPRVLLQDARDLGGNLQADHYTRVITSPPYCNRMSYIRELRPYMYWLGFLADGRGAGELDWRAIGGTWGCATSNLVRWRPETVTPVPYHGFERILGRIAARSDVLSRYVHKYFLDMTGHCRGLFRCVRPGASFTTSWATPSSTTCWFPPRRCSRRWSRPPGSPMPRPGRPASGRPRRSCSSTWFRRESPRTPARRGTLMWLLIDIGNRMRK